MASLKGKVLWLTGASSGIGEAFARRVAKEQCRLVITARRAETLNALASDLSRDCEVLAIPGDVTDLQQMISIAEQIAQQLSPVDVLVANAGTHIPTDVRRFDANEYDKLMQINFLGVLYCIEAVLPEMIERQSGHIVGVSSVAGYRGLPKAAAYGASKAALSHFLESLRFDLVEHNVDVSVVSPGFVKTPLTDKNEFEMPFLMEAEDAAESMVKGISAREMEVHFPKKFTYLLKLMRVIPYGLYHKFIVSKVVEK